MKRNVLASRGGFTLIELMIAVVIVGILVAVAFTEYPDMKLRAYIAWAKVELKYEATAAAAYFAERGTYVGFTPQNRWMGNSATSPYTSATGFTRLPARDDGTGSRRAAA